MASPHASSFICLPFSNKSEVLLAHTIYFGTCIWSALIGALGSVLFLFQVARSAQEAHPGISSTQKWILIMLALSDLLADIGKQMGTAWNDCAAIDESPLGPGSSGSHP